ncbi:MAG: hypothetical protein HYV63_04935 [Candidatus Schekmanbacteria bacterium]|nr:hypothetical protein [Candidatus Schekmanbacteria bacterium]
MKRRRTSAGRPRCGRGVAVVVTALLELAITALGGAAEIMPGMRDLGLEGGRPRAVAVLPPLPAARPRRADLSLFALMQGPFDIFAADGTRAPAALAWELNHAAGSFNIGDLVADAAAETLYELTRTAPEDQIGALFRSMDAGQSWQRLQGVPAGVLTALALDVADPVNPLLLAVEAVLYRGNGESWSPLLDLATVGFGESTRITHVAVYDRGRLLYLTALSTSGQLTASRALVRYAEGQEPAAKVLVSLGDGIAFYAAAADPRSASAADPTAHVVYLGLANNVVYRITGEGAPVALAAAPPGGEGKIYYDDAGRLLAGVGYSTTAGGSWSTFPTESGVSATDGGAIIGWSLAAGAIPARMYAAVPEGLAIRDSDSDANPWRLANHNLKTLHTRAVAVAPGDAPEGAWIHGRVDYGLRGNRITKTSYLTSPHEQGEEQREASSRRWRTGIEFREGGGQRRVATRYAGAEQRVYRSTDGAVTWQPLSGPKEGAVVSVDPANQAIVFAGGRKLFRSTDGGDTWAIVLPASSDETALTDLAAASGSAYYLGAANAVASSDQSGVYESPDGIAWALMPGTASWQVNAVSAAPAAAVRDGIPIAIAGLGLQPWETGEGVGQGAWVLEPDGATWTAATGTVSEMRVFGLGRSAAAPQHVWAAGRAAAAAGNGVAARSLDGGRSWTGIDFPDDVSYCSAVAVDPASERAIFGCGADVYAVDAGAAEAAESPLYSGLQGLVIEAIAGITREAPDGRGFIFIIDVATSSGVYEGELTEQDVPLLEPLRSRGQAVALGLATALAAAAVQKGTRRRTRRSGGAGGHAPAALATGCAATARRCRP